MNAKNQARDEWLRTIEAHGACEVALEFGDRRVDYAQLCVMARTAQEDLASLGLHEGDLCAVLAPPSVEGVALFHGMLSAGIVLLPLNARLSERELLLALTASGARALVVEGRAEADSGARDRRLAKGAGCRLLALPGQAESRGAIRELEAEPHGKDREWADRRLRRRAERAALVLRTSGTSGTPKGVVIGFSQLMASADGSASLLGSEVDDRWLLCMPLFHIGGLSILIRAALAGATVVLHERFDADDVARAIDDDGISCVSFVATMLARVIETRGDRSAPGTLRLVLLGGGPASESLLQWGLELGYPLAPTYGLTEATSQVATRPPGILEKGDSLSAGLEPLAGVSLRIVDDAGDSVSVGTEGTIEVSGPIVMTGYLDDPQATETTLAEGWLRTGDVGVLDDAGRLRVLDRRSDLILSGGENVYPAEIEAVLDDHEDVIEAGVCGVPDEKFGARPVAFLVLREGASLDVEEMAEFCQTRLASYKCPTTFNQSVVLPRTPTGKLIRRALLDD